MAPSRPEVDRDQIDRAVEALRSGLLIGLPTETVYGLGANADDAVALAAIFAAKGRPADHPLIVHLADADQLDDWSSDPGPQARALAAAFWPGPLTMIVPRADRVLDAVTGGRDTVGLRVPAHPVAQAVLRAFGGGVAAPSANRFGHVSPTTAEHVASDLGARVAVNLDGGPSTVGVESTIVDLTGPEPLVLRPGAISAAELADVLGHPVGDGRDGESRASGMLASHYAPNARVRVVEPDSPELGALPADCALIGPESHGHHPHIALPAEPEGHANGLYRALRQADATGVSQIVVVAPGPGPLRDAVLDRLGKASAPRRGTTESVDRDGSDSSL